MLGALVCGVLCVCAFEGMRCPVSGLERYPMRFVVAALCGVVLAFGPAARAQSPSANDIIKSLKPGAGDLQQSTRGIRPARTMGAPTPAPIVTEPDGGAPAAAPAAGELSVKLSVAFRTGSADLTPGATHTLSELDRRCRHLVAIPGEIDPRHART